MTCKADKNKNQRLANERRVMGDLYDKVTCSIVTYNSEEEIRTVLDSLSRQVSYFSIYVVDNASADNTVKIVKEEFPEVNLIINKKNKGFGSGHNEALKRIRSKYHIVINPDIIVDDNTIQKLVDYADNNSDIVCITPCILNTDGTEQHLPKRNPKFKYFLGGRLEGKYCFAAKLRAEYTRSDEEISNITDIDFCSGCFMFIRTEALMNIGGFDERYFLHFEDADLTRMLQKYGRTVYYPEVTVTHKWKRDNVKNKKIALIALNSMLKYFMKWGY